MLQQNAVDSIWNQFDNLNNEIKTLILSYTVESLEDAKCIQALHNDATITGDCMRPVLSVLHYQNNPIFNRFYSPEITELKTHDEDSIESELDIIVSQIDNLAEVRKKPELRVQLLLNIYKKLFQIELPGFVTVAEEQSLPPVEIKKLLTTINSFRATLFHLDNRLNRGGYNLKKEQSERLKVHLERIIALQLNEFLRYKIRDCFTDGKPDDVKSIPAKPKRALKNAVQLIKQNIDQSNDYQKAIRYIQLTARVLCLIIILSFLVTGTTLKLLDTYSDTKLMLIALVDLMLAVGILIGEDRLTTYLSGLSQDSLYVGIVRGQNHNFSITYEEVKQEDSDIDLENPRESSSEKSPRRSMH